MKLCGETVTKKQWLSLVGGFSGWTLDAMDWMLLSLMLPLLKLEFNLTLAQTGLLATATLGGAAIGGIIFGVLADYYGRVRMLTYTMIWFAVGTFLCGFTQSFEQLLVLRAITGIGIGGEWGVGATLVSEYWPDKMRARAISIVHSGYSIGYAIAIVATMLLAPAWGWRPLFWLGIVPAFVAIWIRRSVDEPESWVKSKEKRDAGIKLELEEAPKFPLKALFSGKSLRITLLGCIFMGGALMANWGINTWLPSYLVSAKGFNMIKSGGFLLVFNLGVLFGYQAYGWLADTRGRRFTFILGLIFGSIATGCYVIINDPQILLFWNFVLGASLGYFGTSGAYMSELYPAEMRATGTAFVFNFGRFMSMLSPFIIGALADTYGLGSGLGVTIVFNAIGLIGLLFLPETVRRGIKVFKNE